MFLKVRDCRKQSRDTVFRKTENLITPETEKVSDLARTMIVVYSESLRTTVKNHAFRLMTDCASTTLSLELFLVYSGRHARLFDVRSPREFRVIATILLLPLSSFGAPFVRGLLCFRSRTIFSAVSTSLIHFFFSRLIGPLIPFSKIFASTLSASVVLRTTLN
jgi:hypothetical protein